jgi:hypothetical protein
VQILGAVFGSKTTLKGCAGCQPSVCLSVCLSVSAWLSCHLLFLVLSSNCVDPYGVSWNLLLQLIIMLLARTRRFNTANNKAYHYILCEPGPPTSHVRILIPQCAYVLMPRSSAFPVCVLFTKVIWNASRHRFAMQGSRIVHLTLLPYSVFSYPKQV